MPERSGFIANGYAARRAGRPIEAMKCFEEAIVIARASGDRDLLAQALTGFGVVERDRGDAEAARRCYEDALEIVRTLDDPLWLAHTVRHLGDIVREQGQAMHASACYEEALAIYRAQASSSKLDVANALRGYALLKQQLGEDFAAIALWREAGELYASVDVRAGVDESERRVASLESR